MGYVDLSTLHTPIGGARPPATYGRQIEANFDFLASPPSCIVFHSATQLLDTSGVDEPLLFNSERRDTASMHSTSANTERLVAPIDGLYDAKAAVAFAANATGFRQVFFEHYSAADVLIGIHGVDSRPAAAAGDTYVTAAATDIEMDAGHYIVVRAQQTSGGGLNVLASDAATTRYCCDASLRWVSL